MQKKRRIQKVSFIKLYLLKKCLLLYVVKAHLLLVLIVVNFDSFEVLETLELQNPRSLLPQNYLTVVCWIGL